MKIMLITLKKRKKYIVKKMLIKFNKERRNIMKKIVMKLIEGEEKCVK